jgi:hypothetical protein
VFTENLFGFGTFSGGIGVADSRERNLSLAIHVIFLSV